MISMTGVCLAVLEILLTIIAITEQQEINYDMEYMCSQTISVFDNDVVLNGRPSFTPADVPEDCIVQLEAGYSDGSYRLQIIIEAIDINNCGVNLAIFNGKGAYGNYLRQVSCRSMTTDTLYTENKAATLRLHRPLNVANDAYVFTIKTRAYKDDGKAAILRTGANLPDGAIAGIILALLALILFAILLAWCWKSGRISDYINNYKDDDDFKGEENFAAEKSESESVTAGTDKNPLVWNTTSSGSYDPKTVPLGRRSFRNARPINNQNGTSRDVTLTAAKNGDLSAAWKSSQTDIKQGMEREMNQGQVFKGRGYDGDVIGHNSKVKGHDRDSKETLEDEVFESDDNKTKGHSRFGDQGGKFNRGDQGRGSGGNRGSGRGDDISGSLRRAEDGSPNRGSLRRGEDIRESGKSTSSNKEEKKMARNLADEAATLQLRHMKTSQSQIDPPSDFDSSSFMSVPEVATVTASVHTPGGPVARSPTPPPPPPLPGDNKSSDDSELREINARAELGTNADMMPNSDYKELTPNDSKKSPSSRKKKKKKPKYEEEMDRVPPEAFEPLFSNPISEEPLPEGMQPLYGGMYDPQGSMYPMQPYGMPYGMMAGMMAPPGMVPPGSQSYSYAYQAAPQPGAPPQQVAGKAAWFVQETPTKDGPVQKTAFMMATESRPDSQQDLHYPSNAPGAPSYSSTPYGETPRHKGSGRRGRSHRSGHPNDTSMVPSGTMSPDNGHGHGHRSALMKSGVDPDTGIETRQALWTDTTRDPTDPPLNSNTKINRKTVTRTTTRGGYGDLPQHVDNITDHLYISMEPDDPAFLAPSGTGAHAITSTETPERDNASYYAGLHRSHHTSPQRAIHPAPHYHESIRDHISYA